MQRKLNGRKLIPNWLLKWNSGSLAKPEIDWNAIEQKAGAATRALLPLFSVYWLPEVENMIVSSADLSNSDKTDGFPEENTCIHKRRLQRCISSGRCFRTNHGLLLYGYGAARRCDRCMRYVLRILRLHETRYPYGCLDGTSR